MKQTTPSPEPLTEAGPATPRALLESECELVQATIRSVARAARLSPSDSEDFHSYAWVQLLEGNCRRIAHFRGNCPFSAFLRIILNRVLLDYRVAVWGRWRPSQEAREEGPQAIELERLVLRDGYPLAALENQGIASPEQIERVRWRAATMVRRRQRETSVEVLPEVACADPTPEEQLLLRTLQRRSRMLGRDLSAALKMLPASDRRLLTLRYRSGLQVSRIAAQEGLAQKPLYRRYEKILEVLRCAVSRERRLNAA